MSRRCLHLVSIETEVQLVIKNSVQHIRCLPYSAAPRRSNDNAKTTPHPSKWSRMNSTDLHSTRSINAFKELSTRPKSCCSWPRRHEEATRRPNNPRGKKADQDELMISPSWSLFWFEKGLYWSEHDTRRSHCREESYLMSSSPWEPGSGSTRSASPLLIVAAVAEQTTSIEFFSLTYDYLYRDVYISQLNSFSSLIELSWSVGD